MFRLHDGSGFQLDLNNGYTVSAQFSPFHSCSNKKFTAKPVSFSSFTECPNAELAVKNTVTHEFIPIEGADVQGYQTINDLILLLNRVKEFPNTDAKMAEVKERAMSNA